MVSDTLLTVLAVLIPLLELLAVATAVSAIMHTRTSQGAIAWTISLVTVPFVALPLYWIFGRSKFQGYVKLRSIRNREVRHILDKQHQAMDVAGMISPVGSGVDRALVKLADMPFTRYNHLELQIDGKAAFKSIFDGILAARSYVLVQFYIVKDDELGRLLKETLTRKAGEGVRICFLYDEIGSHKLPDGYVEELRAGGVVTHAFKTTRGRANRFQLNFRNHRKLVVVDGETAYIGGHNIGDEYLSGTRRLGAWRDTLVKITGPAVQETQYSFIQDWYWATAKVPDCNWAPRPASPRGKEVLVIPSGPADLLETCGLFFVHAINSAVSRVWIASPYFVPDPQVIGALQLAALRGVDVRILLPQKP
ncbi:MAG: phospholipase D-like domain-containing protein, partial [Desulfobacterales bacterium]